MNVKEAIELVFNSAEHDNGAPVVGRPPKAISEFLALNDAKMYRELSEWYGKADEDIGRLVMAGITLADEVRRLQESSTTTTANQLSDMTPKITAAYFCGVPIGLTAGHYCYPIEGPRSPWAESGMRGFPLVDWHPERDGIGPPKDYKLMFKRREEKEGEFIHLQLDGWTLLAAWDRSADKRGECSVSFAFDALLSPEEALAETRKRWPQIIARMEKHLARPVTLFARAYALAGLKP